MDYISLGIGIILLVIFIVTSPLWKKLKYKREEIIKYYL